MKRLVAMSSVVVILSSAAIAQDTKEKEFRWEARKKAAPVVGARSLAEEGSRVKMAMKITSAALKQPVKQDIEVSSTFRGTREVLAVEKGKVSKERVKVERWKQAAADDDEGDTSLEGATVLLEGGTGSGGTFRLEGDKSADVTPAARSWIDLELVRKGASVKTDEDFDVLLPKEPVADGGEWTIDPKDAAQVLYTGAEIDAEKSSVKGKLTQVKVEDGAHVGRVEVKGTLTLTRIKVNGQTIDYKDGGALEIVYVVSGSLEPERSPSRTTSIKMLFDGTGSYDTPQGKATLKMKTETTWSRKRSSAPADGEKKKD